MFKLLEADIDSDSTLKGFSIFIHLALQSRFLRSLKKVAFRITDSSLNVGDVDGETPEIFSSPRLVPTPQNSPSSSLIGASAASKTALNVVMSVPD